MKGLLNCISKDYLLSELKPYDIASAYDKWGTIRFVTPPHPQFDQIRILIKKYKHNRIYIFSSDALRFRKLIKTHIINDMSYKLDLKPEVGNRSHYERR